MNSYTTLYEAQEVKQNEIEERSDSEDQVLLNI